MIAFPNAKINLGLNVISQRNDGYHNIETVLFPIGLSDALEIIPAQSSKTTFTSTGLQIPDDGQPNLCQRAFELLKKEFGIPNVTIHLHKIIPAGSGLGGGSSDAAFALNILSQIFSLNLDSGQLSQFAARLGSDCPFFIANKPMLASGRGELLEPVGVCLKGMHLLLVKPDIHISTAEAYAGVRLALPKKPIRQIVSQPIETWKFELKNAFEESVFARFPSLEIIKQQLYQFGATHAAMSGSGSAIFGLFEQTPPNDLKNLFPGSFFWHEEF